MKNLTIEIDIDSLGHEGQGVGRYQGKVVFVDGALPGERVQAQLVKRKRQFDLAKLIQVEKPSADRVAPLCKHFAMCGGCRLQHLSSVAQINHKQTALQEALARIGKVEPQQWLTPLQADVWSYRHKARLGVRYVDKKERVLVGFREQGSSFITDTEQCEILHSVVGKHIQHIANTIATLSIKQKTPQIEVAVADNACCLIFRVLQEPTEQDCDSLAKLADELDVIIALQPAGIDSVRSLNGEAIDLYYELPDFGVRINFQPFDFTQINMSLNKQIVSEAIRWLDLQQNDVVLDLFCGLGNFTLPIARHCQQVIGVEGGADMVERAGGNAKYNGINNVVFYAADLFAIDDKPNWYKHGITKVMLDPPRSGAEQVVRWLVKEQPEKIVYMSCNPATLARDAGILVNEGSYQILASGVMDMFPHTAHTEAIAVFTRSQSNAA